ncbi:flavin-containing monooxygenase [Pimelobacter simplex]|uniref:flavin-containing monooxygenase n=1 Tax=Nocardioides simplex TaxID=2045 RepID=UPI003AAF66D9
MARTSLGGVSVAIVGGGFSGIAAGVYLRKAGCEDFVIFESSAGPGGTWWDTRYPGAEVDTPSHLYSYSFTHHDWSRPYAGHDELRRYLHDVVAEHDLERHFSLQAEVKRATWVEDRHQYLVEASDGTRRHFDALVSAVGMLNEPRIPELDGMAEFRGSIVHTSRWDASVDVTGKRVAVIGTGSTAAQVVPVIAQAAEKLSVFQRQASWVDPKENKPYTPRQRRRLAWAPAHRLERLRNYYAGERLWFGGRLIRPGTEADEQARRVGVDYLRTVFRAHPELLRTMTPDIPYQGRRPVHATGFLEALTKDNVALVPRAVVGMTPEGVVDSSGEEHPADLVILATGFQTSNYLARLGVVGRYGRSIHDVWAGEPQAFCGVTVPGFPNFFMLYGPNTNFYALVHGFEQQARFMVRSLQHMVRKGGTAVDCHPTFFAAYNEWLQRRLAKSSWAVGDNYFKSKTTGRIVTQWPDGALVYTLLTRLLAVPSARVTRRSAPGVRSEMVSGPPAVLPGEDPSSVVAPVMAGSSCSDVEAESV